MPNGDPLTSITDVDLTSLPGRAYFDLSREWREEFIYFLMVDRFQDGAHRQPIRQPGRSSGVQVPDDFYGGQIKGIPAISITLLVWAAPPFDSRQPSRITPGRQYTLAFSRILYPHEVLVA